MVCDCYVGTVGYQLVKKATSWHKVQNMISSFLIWCWCGHPESSTTVFWCQADVLTLPFANEQFTAVSCAFGVRNLQDLTAGFREMYRVLAPAGRAVILEFSFPSARVSRTLFKFYFIHMLPVIATLISRDRSGAYRYLPRSVLRFPNRAQIVNLLREVGFDRIEAHPLTFGIAVVYVAVKAHINGVKA